MRDKLFTVLLTEDEVKKLNQISGRDGISKADVMRRALEIDETIQEYEQKIDDLEFEVYSLKNEIEELQESDNYDQDAELYREFRRNAL